MQKKKRSKKKFSTNSRPEKIEIRLSGSGGQGLILAGVILAEAAAIYEGKNAVQSQSYGPEARGGASRSDVIISKGEILFPKTTSLDYLLALTQQSCDEYAVDLKPEGLLIVDEEEVEHVPPVNYVRLPLIRTAREEVGKVMTTNIVALGALVGLSGIVKKSSLKAAVLNRVPKGTESLNLKAMELGFKLAEKARQKLEEAV